MARTGEWKMNARKSYTVGDVDNAGELLQFEEELGTNTLARRSMTNKVTGHKRDNERTEECCKVHDGYEGGELTLLCRS